MQPEMSYELGYCRPECTKCSEVCPAGAITKGDGGVVTVNKERCIGCKGCLAIGCPAISMRQGKAVIDYTQCVGCGVCEQLCNFDAFRHEA